ncbi:MAG: hypothetical protein PG978_000685 [Wolbachia endosymbiont of Ctenocephalides felis wCfeF]|nr:MAG: hypothetical protein PG978_000685 [Wolbachia endosymbiont of Ctenocephalides felis wCfeF]
MVGREKPIWWKEESNFSKIVEVAEDVLKSFPNSRIYSLGQSSAWIVKASEILEKSCSKERQFGYIPFSGSFVEEYRTGYCCSKDRPFPNKGAQANYRSLLKSIGLSPAEIVLQHTEKGSKTVILEYTNTGRSIASFVFVLFSWAQEEKIELDDALDIITFARYGSLPPVKYINIYQADIYIRCSNIWTENDFLVALANGMDDGCNSDRLVPYYSHRSWHSLPEKLVGNEEHVATLTEKLESVIQKHLAQKEERPNIGQHFKTEHVNHLAGS